MTQSLLGARRLEGGLPAAAAALGWIKARFQRRVKACGAASHVALKPGDTFRWTFSLMLSQDEAQGHQQEFKQGTHRLFLSPEMSDLD